MASLTQWTWVWASSSPGDGEGQGNPACYSLWGRRVRHDWATEQQQQIPLTCTFLWTSASLSPFSWNKLSSFSAHEGELQLILQNPKFLYPQFKCLSNADWLLKLLISVAEEFDLVKQGQKGNRVGCCCCCAVTSVVPDSVRPHRRQPTRLPHPWDSPGKNTGVGCHFLLQTGLDDCH